MSDIEIFDHKDFGEVRAKFEDGQTWWVAKDVCDVLNLDNSQTRRIKEQDKGLCSIQTPGGKQAMTVVNEPGLYELIFKSRKEEAEKFKDWITHEVLPELRQTGSYSVQKASEFDVMRQMIDKLEEAQKTANEAKQEALQANQEVAAEKEERKELEERVDSLDAVDLEGDLKQRLNKMVQKYAFSIGGQFGKAWDEFKQNFNTAYNTNLGLIQTNEEEKAGKQLTLPKVLKRRNMLEDAIRVANKMINQAG